ncbi:hypothetical protein LTR56_014328 [Elasticomyces elasticus]|nr:hypothetical protein LTR56_014328 [Elasticomyces elasticus]KAK3636384.1 hypothetical protein LTR22_018760 [Elasticomyces elasticus]KAK4916584.1 hypothetical protein LTR49_015417 [Elasticomyces elasticus]KAK5756179.1 hypothetical protein LTS12_013732 [Elasticomyces elasticus]
MAYTPDAVLAKLSTLNESQDSIVSVAQWLLFHRRHADKTTLSVAKKLNLIYLANEVVQQSRARGKQDFVLAFEPVVGEGVGAAYKGANEGTQGKIRRVVEVWRQRAVFSKPILDVVEGRMGEIDRSKIGGGKGGGKLGGSLFGGGPSNGAGGGGAVPEGLEGVSKAMVAVHRGVAGVGGLVPAAENEVAKMTGPEYVVPTPPVHAARLSALMRSLASAQSAVETSISARKTLLAELEKLVATHRASLSTDEATVTRLASTRENIETMKRTVEDGIMRGLSNPPSPAVGTPTSGLPTTIPQTNGNGSIGGGGSGDSAAAAPEVEAFTPPPEIESFTPELKAEDGTEMTMDAMDAMETLGTGNDGMRQGNGMDIGFSMGGDPDRGTKNQAAADQFMADFAVDVGGDARTREGSGGTPVAAAVDTVVNGAQQIMNGGNGGTGTSSPAPGDPRLKRRKMSHPKPSVGSREGEIDIFTAGVGGVDDDEVAALLGGGS